MLQSNPAHKRGKKKKPNYNPQNLQWLHTNANKCTCCKVNHLENLSICSDALSAYHIQKRLGKLALQRDIECKIQTEKKRIKSRVYQEA